jgi:hypothetical protein
MPRRVVALAVVTAVILAGGVASAIDLHDEQGASSALRAVVAQVEAFDEHARGLRYERPVDVHLAGSGQFTRLLRAQNTSDESDLEAASATLVALGLIPADTNLKRTLQALLDAAVVGFYDSDSKRLYVRGGKPTPFTRVTLSHELTHALQDQHFRLGRYDKLKDEASSAVTSLIEGDAVRIEKQYAQTLTPAEVIGYQVEAARLGRASNIPDVLENLLAFPYIEGPTFVQAVYDRGGNSAVDAAFVDPPTTTEQILHPQRYFDHQAELAVKAPDPAAHAKVIDRGQLGEYGLRLLLQGAVDGPIAAEAAAGWGGDRYITWRAGGHDHVGARIVMDTEHDAIELQAALTTWSVRHSRARITRDHATVDLGIDGPRRAGGG